MTVLPVFLVALRDAHPLVVYEMALQMESLITRQGATLNAPGWEEVVNVLEALVVKHVVCDPSLRPTVAHHLQNAVVALDSLALTKQYTGRH